MVAAARAVEGARAVPPADRPAEWWERLGAAASRWVGRHPTAARRLWTVGVVGTWLTVPLVVTVLVLVPSTRRTIGVIVPCYWMLLCWFLLCRTKTIPWSLYSRMFTVSVPWALLVGYVGTRLARPLPGGLSGAGAEVGVAPLLEETAKLVPLLVLTLAAPGRVRRFTVVDWLLCGVASGLGYTVTEETVRRLGSWLAGELGDSADFGASPVSGVFRTYDGSIVIENAGHHVHTALVAVAIGLGVRCWRRGAATRSWTGWGWSLPTALLPTLAWWVAVTDHAGWNAATFTFSDLSGVDVSDWPAHSMVPWPLGVTWIALGRGVGRGTVLLALLVMAMLADARQMQRADGGVSLVAGLRWTSPGVTARLHTSGFRLARGTCRRVRPGAAPAIPGTRRPGRGDRRVGRVRRPRPRGDRVGSCP